VDILVAVVLGQACLEREGLREIIWFTRNQAEVVRFGYMMRTATQGQTMTLDMIME
jgi:hypothetical protein